MDKRYIVGALILIGMIAIVSAQLSQQKPSSFPSETCKYNTDSILKGNVKGFAEGCNLRIQKTCSNDACFFYENGKLVAKVTIASGKVDIFV